jgi:outer membrane protein assembly factor BamA
MKLRELFILGMLLATSLAFGEECVVKNVRLEGVFHSELPSMYQNLSGEPCAKIDALNRQLIDWHLNHGFPFAKVFWELDSSGLAVIYLDRGSAWVWAPPENKEPGKTQKEVFGKLTGLEIGDIVSLEDLDRAEKKLARNGYYEKTAPVRLYRDPVRNRLIPLFSMADLRSNHLEGYLTYASGEEGGWSGNLLVDLYNINGTARDLSISGETGEWERNLTFAYKEPWLLGTLWSGILRGYVEEDSSYRDVRLEAGIARAIGFDFEFTILGGVGDDEWTTSLEMKYRDEDRFILPRSGSRLDASMTVLKKRLSDSTDVRVFLEGSGRHLMPIYGNFILQSSFWAGTILPTNKDYGLEDLYSLGGIDNLKGFRPGFFRSRAYGATEMDLQWQGLPKTAFHLFFQPALHRARSPEQGWVDSYSYGLGLTQYRESWSVSLYYAMNKGEDPLNGLLHLGVKSLF